MLKCSAIRPNKQWKNNIFIILGGTSVPLKTPLLAFFKDFGGFGGPVTTPQILKMLFFNSLLACTISQLYKTVLLFILRLSKNILWIFQKNIDFHWKVKQFTPFYLVKNTRNSTNFTSNARAEIESYKLNQESFGIF